MGVSRYQDLVCWQLANDLKRQVYALIAGSSAKRDFRFCTQIMESASSGPSNIAEAFGCYRHRESARYVRIAKSSLTETHNHLLDGVDREHWTEKQIQPLVRVANRAIGATTKWLAYLSSTDAPPPYWQNDKPSP